MGKTKKDVDVYRDWLGITDPTRPPNHYALLKLKRFEDDAEKVRANYRKLNAHVRKYAAGEFGPQSQALLNELARAMLCLTDAQRKGEYDATLGRADKADGRRRTMEQILLANQAITAEQLAKVRNFANAVGLPVRDAILQQRAAAPEAVMQAYAESIGLSYIDLLDINIDEELLSKVPTPTARQHLCVPVMVDDGTLLIASPNPLAPDIEDDLRLRFGVPARTVLCTPASINALIAKYYSKEAMATRAEAMAKAKGKGKEPVKAELGAKPSEAGESKMTLAKMGMIAWIIFMSGVILFVAYKMIKS